MILVFGATGKIGSEVVRQLSEASIKVRAFVRDPAKMRALKGVEVVRGDLDNAASIAGGLRGVDTILLLTAPNAKHELAVIDAAKKSATKKIVKISAMGADATSERRIARAHGETEEALKASGITWTILRPGMFAQNFLMFAGSVKESGKFFASVGDGKAATIDARDIAEVAVRALTLPEHDGKTYILTGNSLVSYSDAAKKISAATGKAVTYVDVPLEQTKKAMIDHGMPEWLATELVGFQAATAAGRTAGMSTDTQTILGRPPRTFDDFARDYASAFA